MLSQKNQALDTLDVIADITNSPHIWISWRYHRFYASSHYHPLPPRYCVAISIKESGILIIVRKKSDKALWQSKHSTIRPETIPY
jgi:hypothetical protein